MNTTKITVEKLNIYPVKSMGGMEITQAEVGAFGFQNDRRFMLIDANGQFLTQRQRPELTQFHASIQGDTLQLCLRNSTECMHCHIPAQDGQSVVAQVWNSRIKAKMTDKIVNDWISEYLKSQVRLVYMPDSARRSVPAQYAGKGQFVSFADGYPYLLTTVASLADLNSRLETPISMDQFRPNIVLSGTTLPFEEDQYAQITIGNVHMRAVKPCARCIVVTTHQETGQRNPEPLAALSQYRKTGNKVLFGQNVILLNPNKQKGSNIRVGDTVTLHAY